MTSQVFYRKWRPQTLSEVFGQEHVTQTLRNALILGRIGHAYLFCGPRGTGKTSTGRILAKAVNCLSLKDGEPCNTCSLCEAVTQGKALDVIEIDAASNRGIDEIRDLREKVNYAPSVARYKVYIIDEVHMLTEAASNALLKTLEEPPSHVIFVLATTEPHKVLPTILSRCQRFDFRRLSQSAVISKLASVCKKENINIEPETLRLIARATTGSLRDAENLLEQMVAYFGHEIQLAQAQTMLGVSGDLHVKELARHIVNEDISAGLQTINSISSDGIDLRQFNRGLVDYLRNLLLIKSGSEGVVDLTSDDLAEAKALLTNTSIDHLLKAVKTFSALNLRLDNYSTLPLELSLIECALPKEDKAVSPRPVFKELPKTAKPSEIISKLSQETTPASVKENIELPEREVVRDISYFRSHWGEFISSLKGEGSSGNLDAMLRSACEPVAVEGNILTLGFYYSFHKDKIEDPKYRHLVEKKLRELFGQNYQLRCILTNKERKGEVKTQPKSPVIRAALEMGAKIIDEGN